jgi:galactoside O-acetyltransferase
MAFLTEQQLQSLGLNSYGKNVLISDKASIYNAKNISIGNNVRIDDFCILSAGDGGINIGNRVHIACYTSLIGKANIFIGDFSVLSSRVSVYSSTDDFSGEYMISPMVDSKHTNVTSIPVFIDKYVVVGCGSVLLPGAQLAEGCALGSMTLLKEDTWPYKIYVGSPARYLKDRLTQCAELAKQYE